MLNITIRYAMNAKLTMMNQMMSQKLIVAPSVADSSP
jgi:hypothetical protein